MVLARAADEFALTSVLLFLAVTVVRWLRDPGSALYIADLNVALVVIGALSGAVLTGLILTGVLHGPGTWYAPGGAAAAALAGDPNAPFLGYIEADSSVTSFVHVADAAGAAVAALDWPAGPVNIVDDETAQGREWVPVLATALGVPAPKARSGRQSWARGASNGLARSRGWRPEYPTWRTGFAARHV